MHRLLTTTIIVIALSIAFVGIATAAPVGACRATPCHASFRVGSQIAHWHSRQTFKADAVFGVAFYVNGHALSFLDGGCDGWIYGRGVMLRLDTCVGHIRIEAIGLRGRSTRVFFSYQQTGD
jgi:hypothetical protein